jgi:GNAT superfamily N-acetyltransferase
MAGHAVLPDAGAGPAGGGAGEVVELTAEMTDEAVAVLADAFLDDPAWVAIGPRRESSRRRLLGRYYDILVGEALRFGGPNWCVVRSGSIAGVALTYMDGLRFPPPGAFFREAPPFLLAGPAPGLRAAWVDSVMKRAHPHEPHVLLWYLGARPDLQRQGVGTALLAHVRDQAAAAGLPIYLDTTKLENVAYYESRGYRCLGGSRLVRRARVWYMHHDAPRAAADQGPGVRPT